MLSNWTGLKFCCFVKNEMEIFLLSPKCFLKCSSLWLSNHGGYSVVGCMGVRSYHCFIPVKRIFSGLYWNHRVCPSVLPYVCGVGLLTLYLIWQFWALPI